MNPEEREVIIMHITEKEIVNVDSMMTSDSAL